MEDADFGHNSRTKKKWLIKGNFFGIGKFFFGIGVNFL
jgi:hypothetical protein